MAKYSFEFKLKIVQDYLSGKSGGTGSLAKKYGISSKGQISIWIENYKHFGEEGLKRSRRNEKYSFQFKADAIELYKTTEITFCELAIALKIKNPSIIANWIRAYNNKGIDGLSRKQGRPQMTDKIENANKVPKSEASDQKLSRSERTAYEERIEGLEHALRMSQIETAFLKELRRLRNLEAQKAMKKLHK